MIEYKVEGSATLQNATSLSDAVVAKWERGNGFVYLHCGNAKVRLDSKQPTELASISSTIASDINEKANARSPK